MPEEEKIEESFEGKSGKENKFVISNEYPFTIMAHEAFGFTEDDLFTLESSDGSYSEKVTYSSAEKNEGYCILWFSMPPKGKKYNLKFKVADKNEEGKFIENHILEEEVLTFRDDETFRQY